MTRTPRLALAAALLGVMSGAPLGAADAGFKVVVSPASPVSSLERREVARMFLKRTSRWPDGKDVVPVDQSSRSETRTAFTRLVLGAEGLDKMSSVENFWQQQVFSGRGVPPLVKAGDAEVIAFVASNPGAIGYVSKAADTSRVKTIALTD
jgi:ABC-type phosphate transport system substrate-binding protein